MTQQPSIAADSESIIEAEKFAVPPNRSIADIASLLADPTRAEMLVAMMDGRAFPASELAAIAHVSTSTASHHLDLLVRGGIVSVVAQGRHRYHRLASARVADVLESVGALGALKTAAAPNRHGPLAECRSCYDHFAGRVGIAIRVGLEAKGIVREVGGAYVLTSDGARILAGFGIDPRTRKTSRPFAKACIDWTERVPHVGGWLGAAILHTALEHSWVARAGAPRQLVVTPIGREILTGELDVQFE